MSINSHSISLSTTCGLGTSVSQHLNTANQPAYTHSANAMTPPNPHINQISFTSSFLLGSDAFKSPVGCGGGGQSLDVNSASKNILPPNHHLVINSAMSLLDHRKRHQQSNPLINSKTPKTIKKRGQLLDVCHEQQNRRQVFGTPDYLSPELLRGEPHNESVDWWALGVCLYEFLVGITPFADQTPELIFENILNRVIEWPEGADDALSPNAQSVILALLNPLPSERMRLTQMKQHPLCASVNWNGLLDEEPPFVPRPDHSEDTCYFETRNEIQNIKMSNISLIQQKK